MDIRTNENGKTRPVQRRTARSQNENRQPMSSDEVRRKRSLEREKKRRRKRLIGYCAAVIALIVLAVVLSLTVFFKIDSFEVVGDEVYSANEIIAATQLSHGGNMFAFSKKDVAERVQTALPYVGELKIERGLTGKLTLTVVAARAVMALDNGDGYILLDGNCKVLEKGVQNLNEGVAVVIASTVSSASPGSTVVMSSPDDVQNLSKLYGLLEKHALKGITGIDIRDYSNVKLRYDYRATLKIGSVNAFEKKIDFIKATVQKLDKDEPDFSGTVDFKTEDKAYINDIDEEKTTQPPEPETESVSDEATGESTGEATGESTSEASATEPSTKADEGN